VAELESLNAERESRIAELEGQVARLTARVELLLKRQAELRQRLEEIERSGKRQAAPFSKGPPQPDPKPPDSRPATTTDAITVAPSPNSRRMKSTTCRSPPSVRSAIRPTWWTRPRSRSGRRTWAGAAGPAVSAGVDETTQPQWQTDLPTRPIVRRFDIHCGHCADCGARVQGRHALQTSDALGAAASQLGPHVHAAKAILNKELGLSHGKIARLMQLLFGITLHRSSSCRSILRTSQRSQPGYAEIEAE
jgi:transposase